MSSISNIGGNSPVQKIQTPPVTKPAETETSSATTSSRGPDKLDLSGLSHLFETLKSGGDVRTDKIADIKAQIDANSYEDDYKLDIATDRLLDDLQK